MNNIVFQSRKEFICAWCGKGKTHADGKAAVLISVQCRKCDHIYICDLYSGKTYRSEAIRNRGRR